MVDGSSGRKDHCGELDGLGLYSGLSISASGLTANSLWMSVIANNIANANTGRTAQGGPYRAEDVVFTPSPLSFAQTFQGAVAQGNAGFSGGGVRVAGIVGDPSPFKLVYDPTNPNAVNGYVQMPNVSLSGQMIDLMTASRAYQANVTAFSATKTMNVESINLGK